MTTAPIEVGHFNCSPLHVQVWKARQMNQHGDPNPDAWTSVDVFRVTIRIDPGFSTSFNTSFSSDWTEEEGDALELAEMAAKALRKH